MSLTTCSKEHCWDASLDNGWCNKHTNERIAKLEAKVERLKRQHQEELFNAVQQAERPIMAENAKLKKIEEAAIEYVRDIYKPELKDYRARFERLEALVAAGYVLEAKVK